MHKNVEAHNIWEIKLTLFLDYLFTLGPQRNPGPPREDFNQPLGSPIKNTCKNWVKSKMPYFICYFASVRFSVIHLSCFYFNFVIINVALIFLCIVQNLYIFLCCYAKLIVNFWLSFLGKLLSVAKAQYISRA